jgi:hypothetical protein
MGEAGGQIISQPAIEAHTFANFARDDPEAVVLDRNDPLVLTIAKKALARLPAQERLTEQRWYQIIEKQKAVALCHRRHVRPRC